MKFSRMGKAGLAEMAKNIRANNCQCETCRTNNPIALRIIDRARQGKEMNGVDMAAIGDCVEHMMDNTGTVFADMVATCIIGEIHLCMGMANNTGSRAGAVALLAACDEQSARDNANGMLH
jgi:hypothetical protein